MNFKVFPAAAQKRLFVKVRQVVDQPVRRKDNQSVVLHIHEHHHDIITVSGFLVEAVFMAVIPEIQGCFIAVMTVCDIKLSVFKILTDCCNCHRIVDNPKPVKNLSVIHFHVGCAL